MELPATPTNLANQVKLGHDLNQSHSAVSSRSDLSAPKQSVIMAIVKNKLLTFQAVL